MSPGKQRHEKGNIIGAGSEVSGFVLSRIPTVKKLKEMVLKKT